MAHAGATPSGGFTFGVDSSRGGPRFDARSFVRVQPTEWLGVRAGYGYLWRDAVDPLFSTRTHDVSALVGVKPLDWLNLSSSASCSGGNDVGYRETDAVTGGTGTRRGARWSTGSSSFETVGVYARTVSVSAGADVSTRGVTGRRREGGTVSPTARPSSAPPSRTRDGETDRRPKASARW